MEENGLGNYFMINLHESMGPGWDQTRDPWICSQTHICSQTFYWLRYAAGIFLYIYHSYPLYIQSHTKQHEAVPNFSCKTVANRNKAHICLQCVHSLVRKSGSAYGYVCIFFLVSLLFSHIMLNIKKGTLTKVCNPTNS